MPKPNLKSLLTTLDLKIKNAHLVQNAFVHRSYLNESQEFDSSNERLEYLGDAVLELITSEYLYSQYPDFQEGMLTNVRAALVRTESLAALAQSLGFPDLLLMSRGEESTGGRQNISILADTFEAFLGALYLDLGLETCRTLLHNHLLGHAETVLTSQTYKDNKSLLQEIAQARFKSTPLYELVSELGPDHDKQFTMRVKIADLTYAQGQGKSKQAAQEAAAKATLEQITHT